MKLIHYFLLSLAMLLIIPASQAEDADAQILVVDEVQNLEALGEQARNDDVAVLLMFSQKGCTYCIILEQDYLLPMLRSGDYAKKVIIRKISIDSYETLRNFDGTSISADTFATNYRSYVTPTMVFLDHNGRELTKRLMGVGTEGFFFADIDRAIDTSLNRLRSIVLNKQ